MNSIVEISHRSSKWQVHGHGDWLLHAAQRLYSLLWSNPQCSPVEIVLGFYADEIADVEGAFAGIYRFTEAPV